MPLPPKAVVVATPERIHVAMILPTPLREHSFKLPIPWSASRFSKKSNCPQSIFGRQPRETAKTRRF